jgi:hypothetical protein
MLKKWISLIVTCGLIPIVFTSPAMAGRSWQWVNATVPSGEIELRAEASGGLLCKKVSQLFECTIDIRTDVSVKGDSIFKEAEIGAELGEIEVFIGEYNESRIKKAAFTSGKYKQNIKRGVLPERFTFKLTGTTNNPENLRIWFALTSPGARIVSPEKESKALSITYDSQYQKTLDSEANPGKVFYPNLGISGAWRFPDNRDTSGECDFGFDDGSGFEDYCERILWQKSEESDGFSKNYSIVMYSENDEYATGDFSRLEISCSAKKLLVNVKLEWPSSFGWKGSGQYRFDSGAGKKFTYRVDRSFDYIWLDNPKAFTAAFLKASDKSSFRVSNQYLRILVFPKSNLKEYASKFKTLGCPLS